MHLLGGGAHECHDNKRIHRELRGKWANPFEFVCSPAVGSCHILTVSGPWVSHDWISHMGMSLPFFLLHRIRQNHAQRTSVFYVHHSNSTSIFIEGVFEDGRIWIVGWKRLFYFIQLGLVEEIGTAQCILKQLREEKQKTFLQTQEQQQGQGESPPEGWVTWEMSKQQKYLATWEFPRSLCSPNIAQPKPKRTLECYNGHFGGNIINGWPVATSFLRPINFA